MATAKKPAPKKPAAKKPAAKKPPPPPEPVVDEPAWSFGPFEVYTEVVTPAGVFGLSSGEVISALVDRNTGSLKIHRGRG